MIKLFLLVLPLFFNGCYFTFSAAMCENLASGPNQIEMPEECRNYNEDEANKAFFNNKIEVEIDADEIEFKKEDKEDK